MVKKKSLKLNRAGFKCWHSSLLLVWLKNWPCHLSLWTLTYKMWIQHVPGQLPVRTKENECNCLAFIAEFLR